MMLRVFTPIWIASTGSRWKLLRQMISWRSHVLFFNYSLVVSENLNSSSFIKPHANYENVHRGGSSDEYNPPSKSPYDHEDDWMVVQDVKNWEKRLPDGQDLSILFTINPVYRKEIGESINLMKSIASYRINWNIKYTVQGRQPVQPTYSIYVGRRLIVNLNLTREYKETIQMVIERYA